MKKMKRIIENENGLKVNYIFTSPLSIEPLIITAEPLAFFKNEPIIVNGLTYNLTSIDYEQQR